MALGIRFVIASLIFAVATPALAVQAGTLHVDGYTIRYNALPSDALPEAGAKRLELTPAPKLGIVNVSVTRGSGYDAPSVTAHVSGHATTSTGTTIPIHFRTIHDGDCISYLGTFTVPGKDTLTFDLEVAPTGGSRRHVHFKQVFLRH